MPFNPVLIVVLFALGLGLAVIAAVRSPGPPLFGSQQQQRALEPMNMSDPAKIKLYN